MALLAVPAEGRTQTLEDTLAAEGTQALARQARERGDARRGAILFHQPQAACARCHEGDGGTGTPPLGPDLARLDRKETTDEALVESVLFPSRQIRQGFAPVTVATADGRTLTGLVAEEDATRLVLRDAAENGRRVALEKRAIEARAAGKTSLMPAGQVNQLGGRQDFLDLVRYLIEIRDGGPARAEALRPTPEQLTIRLPEYEQHVDHAGLIAALGPESLKRGRAIYDRLCVNCHGTLTEPGSLPTSLRFGSGRFKNGSDPYAMYQTLTRGFGMMTPQTWMVPRQKYDVIHYIREVYLKPHNPGQYAPVDRGYLARLPAGNTFGPEPKVEEPWVTMDYGPSLANTYEIGRDGSNFAYKGIAVRVDPGPGGVSRGRAWMVFDHDTLRLAAAWTGSGFIDWNGIQFNGRHQVHPRVVGDVHLANPTGPGWADPETGSFDDERRVLGRDGRAYGPLPRAWAHYRGLYHHGARAIIAYTVGATEVLESPGLVDEKPAPAFTRTFNLGPRPRDLVLQVARSASAEARIRPLQAEHGQGVLLAPETNRAATKSPRSAGPARLAAGISPPIAGAEWLASGGGNLRLCIPAGAEPLKFTVWTRAQDDAAAAARAPALDDPARDLAALTHGGPPLWRERLTTTAARGDEAGPFAVDVLTLPANNPWLAQMRMTGIDFFEGADRAAVSTWDGDVWIVSGLNGLDSAAAPRLNWQRIASGLFQPLGVKIVKGAIHVTCRDELAILRDRNGDGEVDFVENLNNDHQVTEHFHEFAMGLQVDAAGYFYYAKSARHALPALVPHHGTLLRVSPDGARTEVLATGFRAANGVCLNPDGTFFVTDQEGHWTPKNRINLVRPGRFYGNMFGYHDVTDRSDSAMEQPLCWITNRVDRSPAELLWVDSPAWGPLDGALLSLSYGMGKVFVVLREEVDGQAQGGIAPLPIPALPTGLIRGRFHPRDHQLYACGLYAWAGNQQQPGGFYRIRATGKPMNLPVALHARREGLELTFTDRLDPQSAGDPSRYDVKAWSLVRTKNYGSDHHDEHALKVASARLSDDGRTVFLAIPELAPSWCMEIGYSLKTARGEVVRGQVDNTIHRLGP
jgi:putative heme-binding domain-containing protein